MANSRNRCYGTRRSSCNFYKNELANAENPAQIKKELAQKYRNEIANPYIADEKGYIDEVIDPALTRKKLFCF
jgi:acetyl-CoA carboxylase carboxyltransferase component